MDGLTQAIYDRLRGDAVLVGKIATYDGQPAIFTTSPIPEDARAPYIVTDGNDDDLDQGVKNKYHREIRRTLWAVDDAIGSVERVESIAERMRRILHRQPLVVSGWGTYIADVEGPRKAPSAPDMYARSIELRQVSFEE